MSIEWDFECQLKKVGKLEFEISRLKELNEQYCVSAQNERSKYRNASLEAVRYRQLCEKQKFEIEQLKITIEKNKSLQ